MTGTAADPTEAAEPQSRGSLTVEVRGIEALGQITPQARANIVNADMLFYLVTEPITEHYIKGLNARSESLFPFYGTGKGRMQFYEEMTEAILGPVRDGRRVCAAFYGHPGVFVFPSHEAIWRARSEGYSAEMLPAISAEDCLWADLGVEPGIPGCQSYEATDFLVCRRQFDPRSSLVLWQIGVIGLLSWWEDDFDQRRGLEILVEELLQAYSPDHLVVVYQAAHVVTERPRLISVKLQDLPSTEVTPVSTLYVPPGEGSECDDKMLARLGMTRDAITWVERRVVLSRPLVQAFSSQAPE